MTEHKKTERRVGTRLPSNQPVYFSDSAGLGSLCHGTLLERSSGGLTVQTDAPQPVGTQIDIELLTTPRSDQQTTVLIKGEVRHVAGSEKGGYVLGIKTPYSAIQESTDKSVSTAKRPKSRKRVPLTPIRVHKKEAVKTTARPSQRKTRKASTSRRVLLSAAILLIFLLLWLVTPLKSPEEQIARASGITYSSAYGTLPSPLPDSYLHAPSSTISYSRYSEDDPTEFVAVESAHYEPKDSFLYANREPLLASPRDFDKQQTNAGSPTSPPQDSLSPVEQLAHDLERAHAASQSGDRTAALYLTRNAAETASDLPEPWRQVLREFRSSLISNPGEIPVLPKLDDWVTLSEPLKNIPVDAPVVIYVDKANFTMHVVNNGETIWQFPIGIGAQHATPEGIFTIGTKIRHPEWYNNGNPIAAGSPDNPLGDQWLGLSDNTDTPTPIGLHPTQNAQSIQHALSKGCIRMRPQDAQRLYNSIPLGTPIVIQ